MLKKNPLFLYCSLLRELDGFAWTFMLCLVPLVFMVSEQVFPKSFGKRKVIAFYIKGFTRHLVRSNKIICDYRYTWRLGNTVVLCWRSATLSYFLKHLLMVPPTFSESPLVALQPSPSHFKMLPSIWAFNSDHACHRIGLKGVDQM